VTGARLSRAVLWAGLGVLAARAAAQSSASEREAMYRLYLDFPSHVRGGSVEPHWLADGGSFWYADGDPENTVIYKVEGEKKSQFFDVVRLRRALAGALGHEPPYAGLPFKDMTLSEGERAASFTVEAKRFRMALDTYAVSPESASDAARQRREPQVVRKGFRATQLDILEVPSPDGRWFAGERGFDIWLRSAADGRGEALTSDGAKDYQWDIEGAKWSPDGSRLAALKADSRHLALLPILHWLKPTEEVEWARYTKAGGELPVPELHILDILSRRDVRVDAGETRDTYLLPITWRPDGSEFLFFKLDREQKRLDVLAASPVTGKSRIVLAETQRTFIEALPFNFRGGVEEYKLLLTPLSDGKRLLWMSERDGWNHLYLYGIDGGLIRQVTKGSFPVYQVAAVDEAAGWVYFTAHAEARPYDTHLYRVRLDGTGFSRLTDGAGQHAIKFGPGKQVFLDTHSGMDRPPVVEFRSAAGKLLQTLSAAKIDPALRWSAPEEFVVKAADGRTDLSGVLFKPWDFDAGRKYPVLDSIYGGPQVTWVPREFLGPTGFWPRALAQLGFIVFVVDARGTPERGKAFQDVVYGNFGRNEIPDHVAVLRQLAKDRPYMDLDRVGLFGGSWGGYMTVRGMVLAPDVYRAGVAIYPVVDLYDHRAGPIEPFMGLPQNNREGYEYGSSLRLADRLQGHLMLIHGTSDVNATFSATMKMVDALTRAGKPYDLVVLPEQTHRLEGGSLEYVREAVRRYFVEHLKP
jgi:dipeptidyl-peptidase-4